MERLPLNAGMRAVATFAAVATAAVLVTVYVMQLPDVALAVAGSDGNVNLNVSAAAAATTTAAPGARASWYACLDPALNRTMVRLLLDDHLIEVDWKRAKTCLKDRSIAFGNPSPSQRMLTPRA